MGGADRVHNSVNHLRLIIIAFLCLTGLSWAVGPTVVQSSPSTCFSNSTTTVTCSMGSAITAGNSIWIFQGEGSAGATISTPTMTGETFTKVTGASLVDSGLGQVALYVAAPAAGGQTSFACHSSAAEDIHCHAIEVSGQSASPVDCSNTAASRLGDSIAMSTVPAVCANAGAKFSAC